MTLPNGKNCHHYHSFSVYMSNDLEKSKKTRQTSSEELASKLKK